MIKNIRFLAAALLAIFLLSLVPAFAQQIGKPSGYVNDFASVIDPAAKDSLEASLSQFEQETSVEIAVVTVPNLNGTTLEDYAVKIFEEWGIGEKGVDNGLLLLIARDEKRVRIEVGYGMEPYITDGKAGKILDDNVVTPLKAGNYTQAAVGGAQALVQAVRDSDYEPGSVRDRSGRGARGFEGSGWLLLLIPGIVIITYLVSYMARTNEIVVGTISGAVLGGIGAFLIGGLLFWVLLPVVSGVFGLLLDLALSKGYKYQSKSGTGTGWRQSWGGFYGGGPGRWGGGGGGGGGGGFGGFGGGHSGGGGASR